MRHPFIPRHNKHHVAGGAEGIYKTGIAAEEFAAGERVSKSALRYDNRPLAMDSPPRPMVWVANSCSSGDRDLKQPTAVLPPSIVIKRSRSGGGRSGPLRWRGTGERAMNAMSVVIVAELLQLPRQVHRVPEEYPIEILTPDRPNHAFDKRMRNRGC